MTNEKKRRKLSPITWILIGILAALLLLASFVCGAVGSITSKNVRHDMETVASERAKVVEDYVIWAEDTLRNFSHAAQIKDLLLDPNDVKKQSAAQKYVSEFAAEISDLEGIFIADWESKTLAHINPKSIGIVTREGEALDELHDALTSAGSDVYNVGVAMSPTGVQVVTIYKAVYNEAGDPIGFVGLAVGTENLLSDLSSAQISGLEESTYALLNAVDNVYLYSEDRSEISSVCTDQGIQDLNAKVMRGLEPASGIAASGVWFKDGASKTVSAYQYIPRYHWTLFINAPTAEVYAMTYQLQTFIMIFGILIILLVAVFGIINAHHEKVNRRLGNEIKKNEATQESLETAMFNDILTEVKNRTSLEMELDKIRTDKEHPCYFVMFDVSGLSSINVQVSNDAGDAVLCNTAETLTESFPNGTVYRTGDDEFVVVLERQENSTAAYNTIHREVADAHTALLRPQDTPDGKVNVAYKVAMVRSSYDLSSSIVAFLKDMTKRSGKTTPNQISFVDMDTL